MTRITAVCATVIAVALVGHACGEPMTITDTVYVDFDRAVPNRDTGAAVFLLDPEDQSFTGPHGTVYSVDYEILITAAGGNVAGGAGVGVKGSRGGKKIDRLDESLTFSVSAVITPDGTPSGDFAITAQFDEIDFPSSAKQKKDAGWITSNAGDDMVWDNSLVALVDPCALAPGASEFTTSWIPAARGNRNAWAVQGASLTWTATVAAPEPHMLTALLLGACGLLVAIRGTLRGH